MRPPIPVVDLSSGIVEEISPDTVTLDVPADLDERASQASLDDIGRLHYAGTDGMERTCGAEPKQLSQRRLGETCLVRTAEGEGDRHGRRLFHLSILEE
jgi:hypothetical protein